MTHPFLLLKWVEDFFFIDMGYNVIYTWFVMLVLAAHARRQPGGLRCHDLLDERRERQGALCRADPAAAS